ncbi:MAG: helicase-related protein [Eubacterium sp.]
MFITEYRTLRNGGNGAKNGAGSQCGFAHGQMGERQLEEIMYDFVNGDIDVLVCTTIIETGLDISNANTMIIHNAERMGLSQLYQLRGRVGRSTEWHMHSLCIAETKF